MPRVVKLFLWTVFFVAVPITVTWAQSSRQNCIYDYLKYCSAHSPTSKAGQDCMRRHGPELSDRCITSLVSDGIITLDEVKDIADDAGLEIVVNSDGSLRKRRKIIAFFDPPLPERNPRRLATQVAAADVPLPERNPKRIETQVAEAPEVTVPKPEEIKPVPPPEDIQAEPIPKPEATPPVPEKKPEEKPKKKKSILERTIEVIKKGYEKDYTRRPEHKPETVHREKPRTVHKAPAERKEIRRHKVERKERVVRKHTKKRTANRVKKLYKRKRQSIRSQDRRRNKRLHGFDSDYVVTPGGYGSDFRYTNRFRIQ